MLCNTNTLESIRAYVSTLSLMLTCSSTQAYTDYTRSMFDTMGEEMQSALQGWEKKFGKVGVRPVLRLQL